MDAWNAFAWLVIAAIACLLLSLLLVSWRAGEGGDAELSLIRIAELFDFLAKAFGGLASVAVLIAVLK